MSVELLSQSQIALICGDLTNVMVTRWTGRLGDLSAQNHLQSLNLASRAARHLMRQDLEHG